MHTSTTKTLILLRHAKTEKGGAAMEDSARVLLPAGQQQALDVGEWLKNHGHIPERILCSTATRTRQTHALAARSWPDCITEFHDSLYHASAHEMLQHVACLPEDISSAIIIGHNPGIHELAVQLAGRGDMKAIDSLTLHYPPASCAVLQFGHTEWKHLKSMSGHMLGFYTTDDCINVNYALV